MFLSKIAHRARLLNVTKYRVSSDLCDYNIKKSIIAGTAVGVTCGSNLHTISRYYQQPKYDTMGEVQRRIEPSDDPSGGEEKFSGGIRAIGIEKFFTAAAQFCQDEVQEGTTIISVGSGNGTVDKAISAKYRERFGKDLSIMLVDPNPEYAGIVDYETVDHLIVDNPNVVGKCVLFIIWPNTDSGNDNYDIEALRKLQPSAALTLYEGAGGSGSMEFRAFLHDDSLILPPEEYGVYNMMSDLLYVKRDDYGLSNYSKEELHRQKTSMGKMGTVTPRLMKLKRVGPVLQPTPVIKPKTAEEREAQIQENHELSVNACAESIKTADTLSTAREDLLAALDKLGLKDRALDLEYVTEKVKMDYTSVDFTSEIDQAKIMVNAHLSLIELPDLHDEVRKLHPSEHQKHDLDQYNPGIIGLGIDKFLSVAARFCRQEGRRGTIEIISIGRTDGSVEKNIIAHYQRIFRKQIRIKVVNPDLRFASASGNFQTVEDLISKRPYVVGHCVLLILWPKRAGDRDNIDIDAIRKLQPQAALVVYENTGRSGSHEFREFLHDESLDTPYSSPEFGIQNYLDQSCRIKRECGLENYTIEEIARQKVRIEPISGTFTLRMVKMKKLSSE